MSEIGSTPSVSNVTNTAQGTDNSSANTSYGQSSAELNSQKTSDSVPRRNPNLPSDLQPDAINGDEQSVEKQKESVRKHKVKLDGQEFEVDENELLKGYQRARAANQRFEEANRLKKQAEQLLHTLQSDPFSVLSHPELGINAREAAEKYLWNMIVQESMSPEERRAHAERQELESLRQEKLSAQERAQKMQFENLKKQHAANYERQFLDVIDKVGLPKSHTTVKRMANYMTQALQAGFEPDLHDVAQMVREDIATERNELLRSLKGESLLKELGDDIVEEVRKELLAKVQSPAMSGAQQKQKSAPSQTSDNTRMDEHEWREYIRKRAGF